MTTPQPQVPSTASNIDPAGSTDPRNLEEQSTAGASPTDPQSYPEQKHAGAVGYGPNFRFGPTVGDKAGGLMEEMRGKIMHNQEHVHHGHDRRTGELKKREHDEDMANGSPFEKPVQKEEKHEEERAGAAGPEHAGSENVDTQKTIG